MTMTFLNSSHYADTNPASKEQVTTREIQPMTPWVVHSTYLTTAP